tara:strand:+ start:308 stop:640 length:333 start_codon:yes stop_codon:yes gene_type:complete
MRIITKLSTSRKWQQIEGNNYLCYGSVFVHESDVSNVDLNTLFPEYNTKFPPLVCKVLEASISGVCNPFLVSSEEQIKSIDMLRENREKLSLEIEEYLEKAGCLYPNYIR